MFLLILFLLNRFPLQPPSHLFDVTHLMAFLPLVLFFLQISSALKVAVIGEGVIGLSSALALKEMDSSVEVHVYHDRPFHKALSKNIAGLFRIDDKRYRTYGNETFVRLARLWREIGGNSGVQLVSGHIMSEDRNVLDEQQENYGDIVYNFRFLEEREKKSQFMLAHNDSSDVIHYTAFTSEGAKYCPWMKKRLRAFGVQFHLRKIDSLDELAEEGFPIVINCAGLSGGRLAGDDETMYPVRGVLLKVDAPWQKHFLYRDFRTISIPVIDGVFVGTVKQDNRFDLSLTKDEVNEIWSRYTKLQPAMKNARIISHFVGLRPGRKTIRLEAQRKRTESGKEYTAIHNYGHGGNGFTLAWGCGVHAASLALGRNTEKFESMDDNEENEAL